MRRWRLAFLMLGALAVASCTVGAGTPARSMGVIKLGVDLPLSGDDAPDGLPAKNAIDLAIKQAGRVCGPDRHPDACFDLQAIAYDDVRQGIHDPAKGAQNVQLIAGDARVLAMVGPLYDRLAKSELPVANPVRLAMVSPGTTNECLTQEPPDGHCQGLSARLRAQGPNNFFRVVTTQLVEGAGGADLAFKALGKRRAFVINDQTPFGLGIATAFVARFPIGPGRLRSQPADRLRIARAARARTGSGRRLLRRRGDRRGGFAAARDGGADAPGAARR